MVGMKTDLHILPHEVEPSILARLIEPHSKERPGIPFAWMLSYGAREARQNIRYFENGVRHCALEFPIRVFFSKWSHAIVITFVPLEAIREPHILEWYVTFYEVPVEEAKTRLETWPEWPHDGRNEMAVRTEILTAEGGIQKMLDDSERVLAERGIDIPSKW
jgi:hypothetical protein